MSASTNELIKKEKPHLIKYRKYILENTWEHLVWKGVGKPKTNTEVRKGEFDLKVIHLGDLEKTELKQQLYPKIKKSIKVLIEEAPIVKMFLQERKLSYHVCDQNPKGKEKFRNKNFDVQTAKSIYKIFSDWMLRFIGVATKYLQNYMKWFMHRIKYRNFDLTAYHLAIDGLQNKRGKTGYKESVMFIN